ncbi:hypothetical protein A1O1_00957 [Capronia coronata CBS 617.96]|uniref:Uncharacterized protein n=1 Tax=Capronia coronata CBS 617.96 TaxID=1182541 RepID=W9YSI7_9EURO|nr:uncharacterized protein A1O1_00957 [Capronia coronata CBS 617.96]EXJ95832.1 hypothetical protein A1O1_00957 [Capronia coronata CBS 617.96]
MGLKRKALVLEDLDTPIYNFGEPNTGISSFSSPSSTDTTHSVTDDGHASYPLKSCRIDSVPYFNCRTRKRHRDGRPDEATIHEHTLKQLYDAQRLHLDETMHLPEEDMISVDGLHGDYDRADADSDADMLDDEQPMLVELPQATQPNQKTLDAFFGRRETHRATTISQQQFQAARPNSEHNNGHTITTTPDDSMYAQDQHQSQNQTRVEPRLSYDRREIPEPSMGYMNWRSQSLQYLDAVMGFQ